MTLILSGTDGLSDVDGSAATPAIRGTDANTGIFFPAADTIAFSEGGVEAMRIDSSGNVGIGTSSPNASYKMSITGNSASIYSGILFTDTNAGGGIFSIYGESGALKFRDSSVGATRMTIDSSGNVGVGATPSAWSSSIKAVQLPFGCAIATIGAGDVVVTQNAYFDTPNFKYASTTGVGSSVYRQVDGTHRWSYAASGTAGNNITFTEAMRIDSSGNLLVGSANASLTVGEGFKAFYNSGTNPYVGAVMSSSTNSQTNYHLYSTGAAAFRFYVGAGGTIFATATTITGISDQRLKENIRDLDDGLDVVMALKPRKFDWKEGKGADTKNARGFIAQEFEQVLPDMIEKWKDPAPEGEEPYKAVNANLIPTLVKAIQEQQALITTLTDRITALETPTGTQA